MQVKIKDNATCHGAYYSSDYRKSLDDIRGKWVTVNTSNLFTNQYNLLDYNIRVFDDQVEAVREDERKTACKCGYCGKTFKTREELYEHYTAEEESANDCNGCYYYRRNRTETSRKTEYATDEDGREIETNTTVYVWNRKCSVADCVKFKHREHTPEFFTPKNTYFLRYPNGYAAYIESLSTVEKWREVFGAEYEKMPNGARAIFGSFIGTYSVTIWFDADGAPQTIYIENRRNRYAIVKDDIKRIFSNWYGVHYTTAFNENGKPKDDSLKGFPKTRARGLEKFFDGLRTKCRNDYARALLMGTEA